MDMIWLTSELEEIGPCYNDVDFDVGVPESATNDFQMSGLIPGGVGGVYVPGTEFGGMLEYAQTTNYNDSVKTKGWTWRGLLTQGIIAPDSGQDYKIVSGDAHAVMRSLLSGFLGGFFNVPETVSGININNYQFARYCTILDGLTAMLDSVDAKMVITAEKPDDGSPVQITLTAKPIEAIGDKYTIDSRVDITHTDNRMGINHLICLGQGELKYRTRVDLYIDVNGVIGTTPFYTGRDERTAVYDYSSAENVDVLTSYGKKRLLEVASQRTISIDNADIDGDVGDLVYGYMHGIETVAPITHKILTISGGIWKYESKIKGVT